MEETKSVEISNTTGVEDHPCTVTTQNNNKRKDGDNHDIHTSSYSKIRALVHQLRPHFIEVLRTPDFRRSKAAQEIQNQIKLLMDMYKQIITESEPKSIKVSECRPLSGESMLEKEDRKELQEGLPSEQPQPELIPEKSAENKTLSPDFSTDNGQGHGSYIVGGAVFGWNFITFGGSKPVYYGRTKESYQRSQEKLENGDLPIPTLESSHDNMLPEVM